MQKNIKEDPPGLAKTILTGTGAVISLYVGWHFYQAGYSIKRTELRLVERFRRLPLYPPPGPGIAEINSTIDFGALEKETADLLVQYFLLTDGKGEGITRDDIVVLVEEELHLGKEEEKNPIGKFINRGRGEGKERKRLSQVGLQEYLALIDDLISHSAEEQKVPRSDIESRIRELMQSQVPATFSFKSASFSLGKPSMTATPSTSSAILQSPLSASSEPTSPFPMSSQPQQPRILEDVDDRALLELELQQLEKSEQALLERRTQRGLTPAEETRLRETQETKREVEGML